LTVCPLSSKKKRQVLAKTGRLTCEVCDFDFAVTYGERGVGLCRENQKDQTQDTRFATALY